MSDKIIGLFGGTFNPPHKGHLRAAKEFCRYSNIDTLYVMPSYITPLKQMETGDSPQCRFEMAQKCFAQSEFENTKVCVCDYEISKKDVSYTVDTVNYLLKKENVKKICVFVGSDMFMSLETWKNTKELFEKCIFVTCPRQDGVIGEQIAKKQVYTDKYGANCHILDIAPLEISSTLIRELVAKAVTYEDYLNLKNILTERVLWYIINNGLFMVKLDKNEILRKELSLYVKGNHRKEHIYSVCNRAVFLTSFFKEQVENFESFLQNVKDAALLHDIAKELNQKELCAKYNIDFDAACEGVVHAKTGAFLAREVFDVNTDVFDAIYYHTTGKENMSLLEKLIFIADYTEETRKASSCIDIRNSMDKQLYDGYGTKAIDKAILQAIDATLKYLEHNNKQTDVETLRTKEYLLRNTKD